MNEVVVEELREDVELLNKELVDTVDCRAKDTHSMSFD